MILLMILRYENKLISGWIVVGASSQSLQEGVDLVTRVSNDLFPSLYGALAPGQTNVVFGAFGITNNLAMLLEASSGKTRQEIMKVLNVTLEDIAALRVGFKAYCTLFLVIKYTCLVSPLFGCSRS